KSAIAIVLILGFVATGATLLTYRTAMGQDNKKPAAEKPVEPAAKQEKEKETFTVWGKEVGGLQAGLGFRPGEKRPYHHGEEAWIVLRLRNFGKAPVEFSHIGAFFVENPPTITDADGKILNLPRLAAEGLQAPHNTPIAPGKEVVLYEWNCGLLPIGGISKNLFAIHGTGKFTLQCTRIVGPTTGNPNHPNPTLDKLATGKLDLEVKEAEKVPGKNDEKEAFTVWGKEIDGLQAGLGYPPGQHRTYYSGETARLVVRVRNVSKDAVDFQYYTMFFMQKAPTVQDGEGKPVQFRYGIIDTAKWHEPVDVNLAPGKEIVLSEAELLTTVLGPGRFTVRSERVFGKTYQAKVELDPALSKLATGKLELETKAEPPPAAADPDKANPIGPDKAQVPGDVRANEQ